ncbi:MAG: hypothetical protein OXG80_05250 [Chloroflexi bacterium]|nr:hypothetical protein [Chloroflexota bacterium]MCY3638490.1 hypothetical protein [Chloroflexota bacterium]
MYTGGSGNTLSNVTSPSTVPVAPSIPETSKSPSSSGSSTSSFCGPSTRSDTLLISARSRLSNINRAVKRVWLASSEFTCSERMLTSNSGAKVYAVLSPISR